MARRFIAFFLSLALAACASTPPALGPVVPGVTAEQPDVKVGDKYTFACTQGRKTYDSQTVITSVDASSIKFTSDGIALENTREGNPVKEERFLHSDFHVISFPLEVGKTWTFNDRWKGLDLPYQGTQKVNVAVAAYEKVRVTAGEFDAFKVQWIANWTSDAGGTGRNTGSYWYAPRVRASAKVVIDIAGEPELACELKEFQLQP